MRAMRITAKSAVATRLSFPLVGEDQGGGSRRASLCGRVSFNALRGRDSHVARPLSAVGATPHPNPPPEGGRESRRP
jgi:hypothetical protein